MKNKPWRKNEEDNPTLQRWKITPAADLKVTSDFLIPPSIAADKGGDLRHIEKEIRAELDEFLATQKQSGGTGEPGKKTCGMAISILASWFSP